MQEFLTRFFAFFLVFILVTVSSLRLLGEDIDFQHYLNMFNYGYDPQESTKEVSFVLFRYLAHELFYSNFYVFLLMYAALGVSLKLYAIVRFSAIPLLSIFIYLSIYFPLHEYTQIRVGVAAAILLFAISDVAENRFYYFLFKIFLATLFHWVSVIALIIYPVFRYLPLKIIYLLPILGFLISLNGELIDSFMMYIFSLNDVLNVYYSNHAGHKENFNVFNVLFLFNLFFWILIFFTISRDILFTKNTFTAFYVVFTISIFVYLTTSVLGLPVISHRLFEFLNISLIILLPNFVALSKHRVIPAFFCNYLFI